MITTIFLIIISALVGFGVFYVWNFKKQKVKKEIQASVLLEQIKKVCKLISVEGDFQEMIDTREEKSYFFDLLTQRKKALLIVKAKAHVGYDLTKLKINMDKETKTISLSNFPEPEIIALETDITYYDISNQIFNKYKEEDLTELQRKAKKMMQEKVLESKLPIIAQHQAEEIISLLKSSSSMLGWSFNEEKLEIENVQQIE